MNKQIYFNTLFSKKNVSLFIFLFVNFIFSLKYISRETNYYLIISFLISLVYFFIWRYKNVLERLPISLLKLNYAAPQKQYKKTTQINEWFQSNIIIILFFHKIKVNYQTFEYFRNMPLAIDNIDIYKSQSVKKFGF